MRYPIYLFLPSFEVVGDMVLIAYHSQDEIKMYDAYGNPPVEINEERFNLLCQMAAERIKDSE